METMKKRKHVSYTLPTEIVERLKVHSDKTRINMSVLVQLAIEEYLRKEDLKVRGE